MIKTLGGLVMAGGFLLGVSSTVAAYPPEEPTVTVSNLSPVPGGPVTVTFDGCGADETATFTLGDETATSEVVGGIATAELTAPDASGPASGTVVCSGGTSGDFEIVVSIVPLPETGGSALDAKALAAGVILVVGAGLLGVSQVRRRRTVTA